MHAAGERWKRRAFVIEPSLWARLKARAVAEGTSISSLVRQLLSEGVEAREAGPGAVPPSKAERLLELVECLAEAVRDQAFLTGAVGRAAMGTQALIVHWVGREDALGVDEERLSAELQAVGAEAWQQVLHGLRAPIEQPAPRHAGGE